MDTLLSGLRVLDLCEDSVAVCGKILGDMGADVIKVEKPGGSPSRDVGPFYQGIPNRERSLFWFAFNNNKRGITLDIETVEGQQIFKKLVERADIVLENFHPGYMDKLGLGYEALKAINPRIIMTSITPFGQTGPYKDYKAYDIVAWAMGSIMSLTGDPDRAPLQCSVPQAYVAGGTYAAEGTMVAYYERENSGLGQHVDVSIQAALAWINSELLPIWTFGGFISNRTGTIPSRGPFMMPFPMLWRCKDGYVNYMIMPGMPGAERNKVMAKWLEDEGLTTDYYRNKDWDNWDWMQITLDDVNELVPPLRKLFSAHTRDELFAEALKRVVTLFPIASPQDIVESPNLKARNYWQSINHDELGTTIIYPGPFALLTETPVGVWKRAPLIGEHNKEIYIDELCYTAEELTMLKGTGAI